MIPNDVTMATNMTIRNLTFQLIGLDDDGIGDVGNGSLGYGPEDYSFGYPDQGRYSEASSTDISDYFDQPTGCPYPYINDSLCNLTSANTSINTTAETFGNGLPLSVDVILATFAAIVSVITIAGNILVLMAFFVERQIRQPTNYFIASLAVSDLLIGIFSMNLYTTYLLLGEWPLGEIICDLWLALDFTVCLTSQYTVFFITVDRFCSVKIPAKYRNWRTEKKVLYMIAFTWIIPTVVFFTTIIGYQYFVGVRTVPDRKCYAQFTENALFNCLLVIGYYWTTLFVMCGLYTGIYKVALDLQRKSEAKHKKMTSLVSMAGQTMSKIGIGMSRAPDSNNKKSKNKNNNSAYKEPKQDPTENDNLAPAALDRTRATSTTSFSSQKKEKEEERSSSPAFPSDTDNDSHSPKRCNSNEHKHEKSKSSKGGRESKKEREKRLNREKKEARKDKTNSGDSNLKVPLTIPAIPGSNSNTPPTDSGYHTVSVHSCEPPDLTGSQSAGNITHSSSIDQNNPQTPNDGGIQTPIDGGNKPSSLELPPSSLPNVLDSEDVPNISLAATPERIEGVGYIDQESLKSLHSADNVKLLIDILPKPNGNPVRSEEPQDLSPIWKKRESMNFDNLDELRNPSIRIQDPSTGSCNSVKPMSTQVDTVDASSKTITKLAKNDELQPLNASSSKGAKKTKKHKLGGGLVSSLAKTVGSRKRNRSKKEKQKSKSENRARKALRTITFILGAFVLCWTPYHILVLILGFCPNKSDAYYCVNRFLFEFSYWLCYLNSPVNPFCYALANAQFKKTFTRLLKRDFHRT